MEEKENSPNPNKTEKALSVFIYLSISCYSSLGTLILLGSIQKYFDSRSYLATDNNKFFISIYIWMATGSFFFLVACLGTYAFKDHSCFLRTFSAFLFLMFVAEIAGTFYGYSHQDEVKSSVMKRVPDMIKNEYSVQDAVTLAVDEMQQRFNCCGAIDISDWANSSFNNKNDKLISTADFRVPHSCCISKESKQCDNATNIIAANTFSTELHFEGCLYEIEDKIEEQLKGMIYMSIFVVVMQILLFVFCCAFQYSVKSPDSVPATPV